MIAAILSGLTTVAAMIPGLSSLVTALTATFFNAKVSLVQARIGGDVTVATATVKAAVLAEQVRVQGLTVIAGSKVLLFLTVGFAAPFMIYEWKVVVWDTVLMWGTTAPVKGAVIDWGSTIIACLFGSGTVLAAGHMYFNRNKAGE